MSQATLGSSPYRNSSLFSGYYLDERIDDLKEWECDSAATEAFEQLQQLWELEGELVAGYKEDELLDSWIDEVVEILGFGTQSETTIPGGNGYNDRLFFDSEKRRREAAKRGIDGETEAMYGMAAAVLEAKQWDVDFTKKFDEDRSYRDASHQIKYYLERTPEQLQWGILTNGKKWRLYGTKDYATEVYYEIDLPELLESGELEKFKYFYAFFRPNAFRKIAGTTFLDRVWNESETAAQELGEDLQDNVFTALRVLGEGFVHTNDLKIDPDDADARAELKEQSLVLLYRLMFVLYAESRGLIHPDDPDAQEEYDEHFSLDEIRLDIHDRIKSGDSYDDWSGYATQIWGQLEDLFSLIDEGQESLGIPAYNGGLFDSEEHTFLADNEVADRYIAEVIHRLGTTENEESEPVPADYADLDTRHLGSIYEGLLEHEFRIAAEPYAAVAENGGQVWKPGTEVSVAEAVETVEKGELYVVNDDGERKATGAYYTPDYVVNYIVEETVDPLLDDIRADLEADGLAPSDQAYFGRFYSEVQELKILDPAMGSAHFLTSATAYLTEQVMEVVREQERQGRDEQEIRRTIAKECIYGVDINGMAVELGKLSMWLETLAADKPLAFLDHHIKAGNSLVGSDISEVLSDDSEGSGGQLTLTQAFAHARQQTLEHVMELIEELLAIDNDDLADIKSMEGLYDEIRDDPLYQRLFEIANVHTAEEFRLDVPEGVYEEMAGAIEDEDDWDEIRGEGWFKSAQAMADEEDFFHWELEYPEVFFGSDGEKRLDAGFDAVVGNPPYGMLQPKNTEEVFLNYLNETYHASDFKVDFYMVFTEKAIELLQVDGYYGLILPNTFILNKYAGKIRKELLNDTNIRSLVVSDEYLFEDADVHNAIIVGKSAPNSGTNNRKIRVIWKGDEQYLLEKRSSTSAHIKEISEDDLDYTGDGSWNVRLSDRLIPIFDKIRESQPLDSISEINRGLITGNSEKYISTEKKGEDWYPLISGGDIHRYQIDKPKKHVLFDRPSTAGGCWDPEVHFEENKILIRQIGTYPKAALDTDGRCFTGNAFSVITKNKTDSSAILAIINSTLIKNLWLVLYQDFKRTFTELKGSDIEEIPISNFLKNHVSKELTDKASFLVQREEAMYQECLSAAVDHLTEKKQKLNMLNQALLPQLGNITPNISFSEMGLSQPLSDPDSILQETTSEKPGLRIGEATVVRESDTTVEIHLTARYKPDDEDAYETDQWGYTETEPLPALRITDLTETEAELIEAFVPVAVDEAGGFANFRETATKTNSLVDRLRKLTLPAVEDVRDGLENYIQTKERAEELEGKIERTDELIDEIVYELYGLTDEEIKIVEEAVGD